MVFHGLINGTPQNDVVSNACDAGTNFEKQIAFGGCDKYKMREEIHLMGV